VSGQRFRRIRPLTKDHFYEDSETGLLMLISCLLPGDEHQAELARRSEKLVEALAVRVARKVGRPRSTGEDHKLAERWDELVRDGAKPRQATGTVARELMEAAGIATEKAARARVNKALRERRSGGP
jgi:hypothetical protein